MKLTLDHNVIIDLANGARNVEGLRKAIQDGSHQAYIVEIGASEMRQKGVRPDRYDLFEQLLREAGVDALPRLAPQAIWDLTFWDHFVWADDSTRTALIEEILFGSSKPLPAARLEEGSPDSAAWINRMCDVQTMWCHLHYENEIFVTSDANFFKATKMPRLLSLGTGRIATPEEFHQ